MVLPTLNKGLSGIWYNPFSFAQQVVVLRPGTTGGHHLPQLSHTTILKSFMVIFFDHTHDCVEN